MRVRVEEASLLGRVATVTHSSRAIWLSYAQQPTLLSPRSQQPPLLAAEVQHQAVPRAEECYILAADDPDARDKYVLFVVECACALFVPPISPPSDIPSSSGSSPRVHLTVGP